MPMNPNTDTRGRAQLLVTPNVLVEILKGFSAPTGMHRRFEVIEHPLPADATVEAVAAEVGGIIRITLRSRAWAGDVGVLPAPTLRTVDTPPELRDLFTLGATFWRPPFRHNCGTVWSACGSKVLDVRGWGHLTGSGIAHDLDERTAARIQNQLGEHVAALLNHHWPNVQRRCPVDCKPCDETPRATACPCNQANPCP